MGGSKSKAATSTTAPTTVWDVQSPYLADTYQQAQNIYTQQQGNTAAQQSVDQWAQMMSQAQGQYGQAGSWLDQAMGQYGQAGQGIQQGYGLLGDARNQYGMANQGLLQGYGALNQAQSGFNSFMNPGVNPMSDVYARLAGQQFNEQIMPGLRGDAMVAGGLGNSRSGIAQGLAGARVGQQLQDWNAQLYGEDMNRKLQASQGLAGLGSQYGGLAGQQANIGQGYGVLGGLAGQLAGQQAGIGAGMGDLGSRRAALGADQASLGRLYGGLAGMQQALPWGNLEQYRSMIGNPTMVGGGGSSTGGTAGSSGMWGSVASIAGLALAPATGGASLLAAGAVNQGLNSYYK
jgi:hypothetical protein